MFICRFICPSFDEFHVTYPDTNIPAISSFAQSSRSNELRPARGKIVSVAMDTNDGNKRLNYDERSCKGIYNSGNSRNCGRVGASWLLLRVLAVPASPSDPLPQCSCVYPTECGLRVALLPLATLLLDCRQLVGLPKHRRKHTRMLALSPFDIRAFRTRSVFDS